MKDKIRKEAKKFFDEELSGEPLYQDSVIDWLTDFAESQVKLFVTPDVSEQNEPIQLNIDCGMYREFQEKLFNEIKVMQYRIHGLATYVQNDFEKMLEDGTTNKETINAEIVEMDEEYDKFITELNELRKQAHDIMKYYGAI